MSSSKGRSKTNTAQSNELDHMGQTAAEAGEFRTALGFFEQAIDADKRNAAPRYNLATMLGRLGHVDAAAQQLTVVLRLEPKVTQAAQRLSEFLGQAKLQEPGNLDPRGLRTALTIGAADRQPITAATFDYLSASSDLGQVLDHGQSDGWPRAASELLQKRTAKILSNDLLLAALRAGVNRDIALEQLLTTLRRTILFDLDDERFGDKALQNFACSLIHQCLNNGYVLARDATEIEACANLAIDPDAVFAGDNDACRNLFKLSLYQPFEQSLPDLARVDQLSSVRPKILRELAQAHLTAIFEERAIAEDLTRFASIADETSLRVAGQYEANPYPRWSSIQFPATGAALRRLTTLLGAERVTFAEQPFDVLIAGAGTGQHAILSAARYGPNARLFAIDLSAPSLAYATRAARMLGVDTIEFARGDILELDELDRSFDVIEAVGVLHHMADPAAGLQALNRRLKPGGVMYLGLYSPISRGPIMELRNDPDHPGPGCSDDAARTYRLALIERNPEVPGGHLVRSKDFSSLSGFRDLLLHEHEVSIALPDVAALLQAEGLTFRGFSLNRQFTKLFADTFPDDPMPGKLENWWTLEQEHPGIFNGMYQFWCDKQA